MDTAESRIKKLQNVARGKVVNKTEKKSDSLSGGNIRFFLAVLFFCMFCLLEEKDLSFMGITGEKIYKSVCENAKGFDFVLDFPYTLDN